MSYKVKLNVFEGPFDLLVYLIEHAQMSVYDIQVSEITSQYLEYVEDIRQQDPAAAGEFMVLAAALIEIKSRMLLPRPVAEDGAEIMEDPRTELVERILEYKRFKAVSEMLAQQEELQRSIYVKPQEDLAPYTKEPDEYLALDLSGFVKAFEAFLMKKRRVEEVKRTYQRVERERMTMESKIEQIHEFFRRSAVVRFSELLGAQRTKYNAVLTFMSLLELLKQHSITAVQKVRYGEITLTLNKPMGESNDH